MVSERKKWFKEEDTKKYRSKLQTVKFKTGLEGLR